VLDGIRSDWEENVTPLIRDIFEDTQKLLRQEFALAKVEVREEARRARDLVAYLAAGVALLSLSVLLVGLAAAHALPYFFSGFPLWLAFALLAVVSAVAGFFLVRVASRKSKEIHFFPEQTRGTIKESAQWIQGQASM